jgi:hypothetical protein
VTAYAFPCARNPKLFDTGKTRETKAARKALRICETCPVMLACRRAGREGREWGIWGGETQSERWAALGITESDLLPPDCGNEMSYRRHKERGEECEECQEAHNARQRAYAEAARERQRKLDEEISEIPGSRVNPFHAPLRPICGSERGYKLHMKKGELRLDMHPECTCRRAHAEHRAEKRQEVKVAA